MIIFVLSYWTNYIYVLAYKIDENLWNLYYNIIMPNIEFITWSIDVKKRNTFFDKPTHSKSLRRLNLSRGFAADRSKAKLSLRLLLLCLFRPFFYCFFTSVNCTCVRKVHACVYCSLSVYVCCINRCIECGVDMKYMSIQNLFVLQTTVGTSESNIRIQLYTRFHWSNRLFDLTNQVWRYVVTSNLNGQIKQLVNFYQVVNFNDRLCNRV